MKVTVIGKFMEGKQVKKKDGSEFPVICIYNDSDIVQVNGVDYSGLKEGDEVSLEVIVRNSQYGLYVKAVS